VGHPGLVEEVVRACGYTRGARSFDFVRLAPHFAQEVVFQLDGLVRTGYWLVGATSPTSISAVRTTPGTGGAAPLASKQYVDDAIAVNKAYVDTAVANVGSGSSVSKNGDAMSGPLTLAADVAEAKGVNVVLDQQLIVDIKALIVAIEEYAKTAGLQKPVVAK
jgi:hypothetical protein